MICRAECAGVICQFAMWLQHRTICARRPLDHSNMATARHDETLQLAKGEFVAIGRKARNIFFMPPVGADGRSASALKRPQSRLQLCRDAEAAGSSAVLRAFRQKLPSSAICLLVQRRGAVLILQQNQLSGREVSRRDGFLKQHKGKQPYFGPHDLRKMFFRIGRSFGSNGQSNRLAG